MTRVRSPSNVLTANFALIRNESAGAMNSPTKTSTDRVPRRRKGNETCQWRQSEPQMQLSSNFMEETQEMGHTRISHNINTIPNSSTTTALPSLQRASNKEHTTIAMQLTILPTTLISTSPTPTIRGMGLKLRRIIIHTRIPTHNWITTGMNRIRTRRTRIKTQLPSFFVNRMISGNFFRNEYF